MDHFRSQVHTERMKKYGVERMIVERRRRRTPSPQPETLEGYIILDEVGEEEEEEVEEEMDTNQGEQKGSEAKEKKKGEPEEKDNVLMKKSATATKLTDPDPVEERPEGSP